MTLQAQFNDYTCKSCNQKITVTVYPKINIGETPELQAKILNESLFKTLCSHCHHEIELKYDLTYVDEENDFTIKVLWNKNTFARYNINHDPDRMFIVNNYNKMIDIIYDKDSFIQQCYADVLDDTIKILGDLNFKKKKKKKKKNK